MDQLRHWTERDADEFLYRIGADFVQQIEEAMGDANQATLAKTLGVTEGRVSQVLNNPGNLTLKKMIEYARALRKKVSVVCYDDGDPQNQNGPINAQVFVSCWELAGRPIDFFDLRENSSANAEFLIRPIDRDFGRPIIIGELDGTGENIPGQTREEVMYGGTDADRL